jgi:hypothetical protein
MPTPPGRSCTSPCLEVRLARRRTRSRRPPRRSGTRGCQELGGCGCGVGPSRGRSSARTPGRYPDRRRCRPGQEWCRAGGPAGRRWPRRPRCRSRRYRPRPPPGSRTWVGTGRGRPRRPHRVWRRLGTPRPGSSRAYRPSRCTGAGPRPSGRPSLQSPSRPAPTPRWGPPVLGHVVAQVIPDPVGVPPRAVEQPLHPV